MYSFSIPIKLQIIVPRIDGVIMGYVEWLPDFGSGDGEAHGVGGGFYAADGFVPGVEGEAEFAPVDGEEGVGFEVDGGLGGLFGEHVDGGPVDAVLAAFEDG